MNADFAGIDLTNEPAFRLGRAEVRPASREVIWDGERGVLEPRVTQVLVALARRRGQVVSRDELIELCWGGRIVGEDAINRCIAALRRLAARGAGFSIETIARVGYRLTEERASTPRRTGRWLPIAAAAALAVAAIAGLGAGLWAWRHARAVNEEAQSAPVIAVLPFDAMDRNPQSALVAERLDARIGDALTRGGVSVIARAITQKFKGAHKAAAAHELRAAYFVDGDVSSTPEGVRVSARVIDTRTGLTLWSDARSSPPGSDAAPEQMARAIAGFLTWPIMARTLSSGTGTDARMAADVWRDLELMQRGDLLGSYALARKMGMRYPDTVPAQAIWAVNANRALPFLPPRERASAISEGRAAALRAIALDPRIGDAYAGLAILTPPVDWSAREQLFLKGLAVDPDNAAVESMYGAFLAAAGRLDEAVAAGKRATTLDQVSAVKAVNLAVALYAAGQTNEAAAVAERAAGAPYQYPLAASLRFTIAAWSGSPGAAETLLSDDRMARLLGASSARSPLRLIARAFATRRAADREAAVRGCASGAELPLPEALQCLMALTRFGRLDQAFQLAERLYPDLRAPDPAGRDARWIAAPEAGETAILFSPPMAAFRADPRFRDLTERVGLAEYWRRSNHWPDVCRTERTTACARERR